MRHICHLKTMGPESSLPPTGGAEYNTIHCGMGYSVLAITARPHTNQIHETAMNLQPVLHGSKAIRNRILGHKIVQVKDLDPHELNPRPHTTDQRNALNAIWSEVGYARSVLAYIQPNGRLKLIDGHLRTSELQPDDEIEVEILDVSDYEARKLLLTIDPLASLAAYSDDQLLKIREITATDDATLSALWASLSQQPPKPLTPESEKEHQPPTINNQW